jgi:methyl halide transferase
VVCDDANMTDLTDAAWEHRYQSGAAGWDLGQPAPALSAMLASAHPPAPGRIAVLGCGTGQDAVALATAGFDVVGVDFAPSALAQARALAATRPALRIHFLQQDLFALDPKLHGQFDYVWEHTCFCAIAPESRPDYVQVIKSLLKPAGQLLGVFYTHSRQGGPPFGVTPQAVLEYFNADFESVQFAPVVTSIARRSGEEHFAIFRRRA